MLLLCWTALPPPLLSGVICCLLRVQSTPHSLRCAGGAAAMMPRGGEAGRNGAYLDMIAPYINKYNSSPAGRPFIREVQFIVTMHSIGITL